MNIRPISLVFVTAALLSAGGIAVYAQNSDPSAATAASTHHKKSHKVKNTNASTLQDPDAGKPDAPAIGDAPSTSNTGIVTPVPSADGKSAKR